MLCVTDKYSDFFALDVYFEFIDLFMIRSPVLIFYFICSNIIYIQRHEMWKRKMIYLFIYFSITYRVLPAIKAQTLNVQTPGSNRVLNSTIMMIHHTYIPQ